MRSSPNPLAPAGGPSRSARAALACAVALGLACGKADAPDTTSRIQGTTPGDHATNVLPTTAISVTFAREMDPSSITDQSFKVATPSAPVSGAVTGTATQATFTPAGLLLSQTLYTVTLTTAIKDAKGVPLPAPVTFSFTTGNPIDRTAPTVTSTDPLPDATLVPFTKIVTATFSKKLDPATVNGSSFALHQGTSAGPVVSAAVSLDGTGTVASLAPLALLFADTRYTAVVTQAVADPLGIQLDRQTSWSFTTGPAPDVTPPTVLQFVPQNLATGVATNAHVEVQFSEPMNAASVNATSVKVKQGTSLVAGTVALAQGRIAVFTPAAALVAGKSYSVTVAAGTSGVKDVAGNALAAQVDAGFTTGAGPDATPPALVSRSPAVGETGVATNRPVLLVFSEPIAPSSVSTASFAVTASGGAVAGAFAFAGSTVAFVPAQPLPAGAQVSVQLAASIADAAGNALGAAANWSFTTGAAPDATPPAVSSTAPADASAGAGIHAPIAVTFSEPILPASADAASFTLKDGSGAPVPGTVSVSGAVATFTPAAALLYASGYTARLTTAITDLAGNHLAAEKTFAFTTQPPPLVRINEIAAKVASGAAGDTNGDDFTDSAADEFVELLNTDPAPADVSGWVLQSGASLTTLHDQFAFPPGTVLPAGGRAVVFGGGAPAGDFGGALVFTASGLSLTDAGAAVALLAQAAVTGGAGAVWAESPLLYSAAPASGASWVRSPEGSGDFADHTALSGSPGVLWSPGVAATAARPKLSRSKSVPAADATGFDPRLPVAVQFNLAMNAASLAGNVKLYASDCATAGPEVAGAVAPGNGGTAAIFTPASWLAPTTVYCVKVAAAVRSDAQSSGNPVGATLGTAASYQFTTGNQDIVSPGVQLVAPASFATGVPAGAHVEIVFTKRMNPATITSANVKLKQGTSLVPGALALVQERIATLRPDAPLLAGKPYSITVTTAVKDTSGNPLPAQLDASFTTGAAADAAAPAVSSKSPTDNETGVALNRPVLAVFSESIAPSSVDATSFAVVAGGTAIAGSFAFGGTSVIFVPAQPLAAQTQLTATLGTGLLDLSGNPLASPVSWSFTTGSAADAVAPALVSTAPANNSSGAGVHAAITATFSEPLLPSSVNPTTFTLEDASHALVPGAATVSGAVATFTPASPLLYGASYTGRLTAGIADLAGNRLAADQAFAFTAEAVPAVKINEIAAKVASGAAGDTNGDEATDSTQDEFIEVLNTGAASADLSGWTLRSGSTASPGPCGTMSDQFTFPGGAVLPAGGRAVVFGGGAPTGGFGGALVFAAAGLSLTDSGGCVGLRAAPGIDADAPFPYAAAPATGASWVRSPEGTGALVDHTTLAGSPGVLWSPGAAAGDARPKLNKSRSVPAAGTIGHDPRSPVTVQFNMAMLASSLTGNVQLFASDCATASPAVSGVVTAGLSGTAAVFTPSSVLGLSTRYCVKVLSALRSDTHSGSLPVGQTLGADASYEFTTGSPDIVPPAVRLTAPADLAGGVSTTARIEVVFSKPMNAATLTPANVKLKQSTSVISGQVSLGQDRIAIFTPDAPLQPNKVYGVTVTTGVKDTSGNALGAQVDFGFTTGSGADGTAPSISDRNPAPAEAAVAINRPVIVVFSEPVSPTSVDANSFAVSSGGPIAGAFVFAGPTVAFVPAQPLPAAAAVSVTLGASIADLSGNTLGAPVSWSFNTSSSADVAAPTLATLSPADASTGVSVRAPIVATFSEFVLPSTVNAATFLLKDSIGAAVPGAVTVAGNVATFTPLAPFVYGASYTGSLTTGITDAAGNHLASQVDFGFTAQPVPGVRVNEIGAKVASGAAGDANGDNATSSTQDEFVELINSDAAAADISGWVLRTGPTASPGPCGALSDQFTFPAGAVLQPGQRAVVFGGGSPTGDFGGALVYAGAGLSLTDGGACVELRAAPGKDADGPFAYPAAPSNGASLVLSPEGSAGHGFAAHGTVSGAAGVIWSPGVAATDARPKLNPLLGVPAAGSTGSDPRSPIDVQLNMGVTGAGLCQTGSPPCASANVKLYASSCAAASPEVTGTTDFKSGTTSIARFTPTAQLAQSALHCVKVLGGASGVQSAASGGARLAADAAYEFTTGTIAYNLVSAAMTAATRLEVTFSAPPNQAQGETAANYCIAAGGASSCSGSSPVVSAAALTQSTVALTLASAPASGSSFRVFVTGVTRASDATALTTDRFDFTGYVPPPFNLTAAASSAETEVTATFTDAPAGGFGAGSFCVAAGAASDCSSPALAVSAAAPSPNDPKSILVTSAAQVKGQSYKLFATGLTRASDGAALQASSAAVKGFLLGNGSFEADYLSASTAASAPPFGWVMLTSNNPPNLLHAVRSDGSNGVPPAWHGLNVARFDSLTSSITGREAQSDATEVDPTGRPGYRPGCFPISSGQAISVRYRVRIPSGQLPDGTKASVKLWYYKDTACSAASTVRATDTQTAASNQLAGVWELRAYSPSSNPPSDGAAARVSIRAQYVSGQSCGSGGTNCQNDVLYFDDVAVTQP